MVWDTRTLQWRLHLRPACWTLVLIRAIPFRLPRAVWPAALWRTSPDSRRRHQLRAADLWHDLARVERAADRYSAKASADLPGRARRNQWSVPFWSSSAALASLSRWRGGTPKLCGPRQWSPLPGDLTTAGQQVARARTALWCISTISGNPRPPDGGAEYNQQRDNGQGRPLKRIGVPQVPARRRKP